MLFSSRISEIVSIIGNDTIIIEGKNDRRALQKFGINNIMEISGKTLDGIAEILAARNVESVTILTDFDEEGEHKRLQLTNYLSHYGIKINSFARKKVKTLFKIHKIEEIIHFTKFMEDDYTGKTSSIYDKIFNRSRIHNRRRGGETRRYRSDIRAN
jgi:5S rRNA maturation endonuclease (ribonuclease M5)